MKRLPHVAILLVAACLVAADKGEKKKGDAEKIHKSDTSTASDPLSPDSLLNWLRIIDLKNFKLLHAADYNGTFFAVKIDGDGDILFCRYEHSGDRDRGKDARGFILSVVDLQGNELHHFDSKKRSPPSKKITYTKNLQLGPIQTKSSVTIAYLAGTIYPLRKHDVPKVRVRYFETMENGRKKVLFDQRIQLLPKAK